MGNRFNIDDNIKENNYKYCAKCGFEVVKNSKFCSECGNDKFYDTLEEYKDIKENKYCIKCGNKLNINVKFCPSCGNNKFAQTKEEIEKINVDSIKSEWEEKINAMQNKLSNIKEEIDVLDKEVKHLEKRYNTLILKQSDYSEEAENLMTIKQNLEAELKKLSKK